MTMESGLSMTSSDRIFHGVEGAEKCYGAYPTDNKRIWYQRTATGRGTIYLFNRKPDNKITSDYADKAFGWISEPIAQKINLQSDEGYCNFWYDMDDDDGEVAYNVKDSVEFTDNYCYANLSEREMHALAENTNFLLQQRDYKERTVAYDDNPKQAASKTKASSTDRLINANKDGAKSAAYLEAGRIATKELSKAIAPQMPMMVRGYVDSPVGRLILANLAGVAVGHFKPDNYALVRLSQAMITQAYAEMMQQAGIEEFIEKLISNPKIQAAMEQAAG